MTEAQLGGRPGARPPLAPERGGGAPPLQNEKKERMAKISITGTRKPIRVIVEILLYMLCLMLIRVFEVNKLSSKSSYIPELLDYHWLIDIRFSKN